MTFYQNECVTPEKKIISANDESIREGKQVIDEFEKNYPLFLNKFWKLIEYNIDKCDIIINSHYIKECDIFINPDYIKEFDNIINY